MAYITRQDPAYALANSQNEQGAYNGFDQYLSQTPMTEDYWRSLGYTGPMDEGSIQQWMASQGMQTGFDPANAQNALMGASGPVAGSAYSVDDTGDFMRDALLTAAGGYFGGSALTGTGLFAPAAASTSSLGAGSLAGGLQGAEIGAMGATGGTGIGGGAGVVAGGSGLSMGGASGGASLGGSSLGGGGSAMTSLSDFLSGGGSLSDYGRLAQGLIGAYTANRASNAEQQGAADSNALMARMYDQNRTDNQPLLDLRNSTLPKISALMNDPGSITSDPGYQFGLKQGQTQIDNQAAARGGYYSGAQMKASQRYGQDYAGTKLTDSLNRLMGVAGLGQVGANANQSNNNQYSVNGGNGLMQQGNIRGSGYAAIGNTVNNTLGDWVNDWNTRKGPGG